ncbi:MAG: MarR family transcriptional regulator [Pseudanabaena sp.]|nr:MAG: MarR family transcriptional regulator [Pseudanabaena sp.]
MTINWERVSQFTVPEDSMGFLLWQVVHLWQRQVEMTLAEIDITHLQFVLLAGIGWLTRNGDLLTQVRLAEICKIDVMQISQVARKLEAKELIQRSSHPTDTRAKVLNLTSSGEAILEQALPLVESLDANFFSGCSQPTLLIELKKLLHEI